MHDDQRETLLAKTMPRIWRMLSMERAQTGMRDFVFENLSAFIEEHESTNVLQMLDDDKTLYDYLSGAVEGYRIAADDLVDKHEEMIRVRDEMLPLLAVMQGGLPDRRLPTYALREVQRICTLPMELELPPAYLVGYTRGLVAATQDARNERLDTILATRHHHEMTYVAALIRDTCTDLTCDPHPLSAAYATARALEELMPEHVVSAAFAVQERLSIESPAIIDAAMRILLPKSGARCDILDDIDIVFATTMLADAYVHGVLLSAIMPDLSVRPNNARLEAMANVICHKAGYRKHTALFTRCLGLAFIRFAQLSNNGSVEFPSPHVLLFTEGLVEAALHAEALDLKLDTDTQCAVMNRVLENLSVHTSA